MTIFIKRIYAPAAVNDGWRVLVDRLWPRGVRREETALDHWLKEIAPTLGLEIKEAAAPTSADVQQATEALGDVDAIYVPTDNTVVSSLDGLIGVAETKQIPVFGAEASTVAGGAIATYGISYFELGRQTGEQAVRILTEGADPATMPVETQTNLEVYLNQGAAQRMGVTVPQELIDRAKPENITQ